MARRGDAIYLRGKTWYLDAVINGTRHQKRLGKNISRSVALELAQVQRGAILKGEAGIGKKRKDLPFKDAREKFEAWAAAEKRVTTLRSYRQCCERLAHTFGDKRLSNITSWAVEAYKRERMAGIQLVERPDGVSNAEWSRCCRQALRGAPVQVNRELAVLKTLFDRCQDWGLYEGENPVRKVKFRKEERARLQRLTLDEEERLLAQLSLPMRALVTVGIHTSLRIQAEGPCLEVAHRGLKARDVAGRGRLCEERSDSEHPPRLHRAGNPQAPQGDRDGGTRVRK